MNLCSDKHDEVCYECRSCPACVELDAKKAIMEDLAAAQDKIRELESEIDRLTSEPVVNEIREARQNIP